MLESKAGERVEDNVAGDSFDDFGAAVEVIEKGFGGLMLLSRRVLPCDGRIQIRHSRRRRGA